MKVTDTIKEQIIAIRDTELTNMFAVNTVQRLAYDRNYFELVMFIENEPSAYIKFIMTGDRS